MATREPKTAKKAKTSPSAPARPDRPRLYTLDVYLIAGNVTEAFAKKNPTMLRVIQIRGDQSLEDLHEAIFDAFDRFDNHMYEFQFGKRPNDPKARSYVMPSAMELGWEMDRPAAGTTDTTLDELGLTRKSWFYYWFDFGDDWWHEIRVADIQDQVPPGKYPKLVRSVGDSPPQYMDFDEDEDEEDDEEED